MKIITKVADDGCVTVAVIDPTDGAVTHTASPTAGEQVVVEATSASSPADIAFGGCEAIPEAEAESAEAGSEGGEAGIEQPSGEAEGAEAPAAMAGGQEIGEAAAGGEERGEAVADESDGRA